MNQKKAKLLRRMVARNTHTTSHAVAATHTIKGPDFAYEITNPLRHSATTKRGAYRVLKALAKDRD